MADIPILFSGPMVLAILEGRKTQTQRLIKPQPKMMGEDGAWRWDRRTNGFMGSMGSHIQDFPRSASFWCGYRPGDCLWVREAFSYESLDIDRDGTLSPWYWADGNPDSGDFTRPKPSIYMPRWASRLTLIVTDVRVQRLQDISGEDCIAEGVKCDTCKASWSVGRSACNQRGCFEIRQNFCTLWDSLNAERGYGWDVNPWVCAVSFTVHKQNIDQMEAA